MRHVVRGHTGVDMPVLYLDWLVIFKVNHHRVKHHLTGFQAKLSAQYFTDFYTLKAVKFAAVYVATPCNLVRNVADFNQS